MLKPDRKSRYRTSFSGTIVALLPALTTAVRRWRGQLPVFSNQRQPLKNIMRKKIVMVMGVQRSGTTALFHALSHGATTAFNESADDYIYDKFYLRPESKLRALLDEVPGSILLKPISETFRRGVRQVFEEYAAYDLHVVWIYRDPVNATHSRRIQDVAGPVPTVPELADQWNRRNQSLLDALPHYARRITIVRYEDLAVRPSMLTALGERLGTEALPNFRSDSDSGRRNMALELQTLVDDVTRRTLERMHSARSILPGPAPSEPLPAFEDFETGLARDPYGHVRVARALASVHRLRRPNTWAVLRYDDVAASLGDFERFSTIHCRAVSRFAGGQDPGAHARVRDLLQPHLTPHRLRLYASRIERHTRRLLAKLTDGAEFDLITAFACRLTADLVAECSEGLEPHSPMAGIASDRRFTSEEIMDLRRSITLFLEPLASFIGSAVHYLLFHAAVDAGLRAHPADIPAFVNETMRLFPPLFAAKRLTLRPVVIDGMEIPVGAHVYPAIFAANRDPAQYSQPDEMILNRSGPPHLGFSDGPHAWLFHRLGQVERETVLRVLLFEFPPLRPVCPASDVRFAASAEFYVPVALPVRFDR